jgi:CrcB protein
LAALLQDNGLSWPEAKHPRLVGMRRAILAEIVAVAVGGAAGTLARYGVGLLAQRHFGNAFPIGTLAVNLMGCFLMGIAGYLSHKTHAVPHFVVTAATVGFLGGLTTFSAFGNETFRHLETGRMAIAFVNVGANVALGIIAVWPGTA